MEKEILEIVNENAKAIKNNTKLIENNAKAIKNNTKLIENNAKSIKNNAKLIENNTESIERLEKKVDENTEAIKSIKHTLLIIEDCVTNKIPALFDAFTINQEKIEELSNKVEDTDNAMQIHSIRLTSLEKTSLEHSKAISEILS